MNRENLILLRDTIAKESARFEYGFFLWSASSIHPKPEELLSDTCDTTGCVMGWANALFGNADALDLSLWQIEFLFYCYGVAVFDGNKIYSWECEDSSRLTATRFL